MSSAKRETKLSGVAAEDVARSVLNRLRSEPEYASRFAADFNDQYSAAPRRLILEKMQKQVPHLLPPVSGDVMWQFLRTQLSGVKEQLFDELFRKVVSVALELPGDDGVPIAADLVLEALKVSHQPLRMTGIPRAGAILTLVFQALCEKDKPDRDMLYSWTEAAQMQLNVAQTRTLPFSSDEAGRLLSLLSRLERKAIPDSLIACVPSMILLAGRESSAPFLATQLGEPFAKSLGGLASGDEGGTSVGQRSEPDTEQAAPQELLARASRQIAAVFDRLQSHNDRLKQRLRDQEDANARQATVAKAEAEARERAVRLLMEEHREEAERSNQRIRELEVRETELGLSIERLHADLQLSDVNAQKNAVEKEGDSRRRLGEMLNSALGSLRRDLERALRSNPGDELIRNVGISFDALQRRLLRESSHLDNVRLPQELLDTKPAD